MRAIKILFLALLFADIFGALVLLYIGKDNPPLQWTLSPFFEQLGKPVKTLDRAISRVLPIDEIDEKMLGEELKARYEKLGKLDNDNELKTVAYLNNLIGSITENSKKPFKYQVFLLEGGPNAYAMPGGVICVTTGLLKLLENEAEMISILSHEAGHIERGHLFDSVRGEMLRRKFKETTIAQLADTAALFVPKITFSKSQEDEADEYAFRMMISKGYDLQAMGDSFDKLLPRKGRDAPFTFPLRDFFSTHPYLELRANKFHALADQWYAKNPKAKMYIGKRNFEERIPRQDRAYSVEYKNNSSF